jgi:hypothetical protein
MVAVVVAAMVPAVIPAQKATDQVLAVVSIEVAAEVVGKNGHQPSKTRTEVFRQGR